MKKLITLIVALSIKLVSAQETATFENLSLPLDSFWNASNGGIGFENGGLFYTTKYDTSFGGYWASGFAYSSMRDTTNGTYTNLYSAKPGTGSNSNTYIVSQNNTILKPQYAGDKINLISLDITNTMYAATSIKYGDFFATAFGGNSGDVPDFFLLTFRPYVNGVLTNDTAEFYLADYRFSNNSQDYIVNNWRNFSPNISNADSILLTLRSSDNGNFGMNTPAFFCLDNIVSSFPLTINSSQKSNIEIFPNPADNFIRVRKLKQQQEIITIFNSTGEIVKRELIVNEFHTIDVSELCKGIYFVHLSLQNENQKFIKN
ncbi:MAG: DUF4465 domain-containing protein [Bacteroidota bacterium]|jgi:hypothetical protein